MGTTTFVWDPVSDCVLMELDETDNVKAVYTNEARQYGGVLSQRRGNTSHYHHHDALGSTRFLTDSSGNVTDTYLNDAWGNSVASTGTTVNPFKWVGKYGYYTDNSTGQVYVRARMYQPTVARWVSPDMYVFLESTSAFQYSQNQPQRRHDSSGWLSQQGVGDPVVGDCGAFTWTTNWILADDERNGVILQKVCVRRAINACTGAKPCEIQADAILTGCTNGVTCPGEHRGSGMPIDDEFCYWEGWRVFNREILSATTNLGAELNEGRSPEVAASPHDTFANFGCANKEVSCSKGSLVQSGEAWFIPFGKFDFDLGKALLRAMFRDFVNNERGVARACGLNSICAEGSSRGARLLKIFESRAMEIGVRRQCVKRISLAWNCCGVPCGPDCSPGPADEVHSTQDFT